MSQSSLQETTQMTSFRFGIDERNLTVSLMVHRIRDKLQRALLEEKQNQKFTQAQLARKLGVDRSVINRQLSGRENISVRRLAEFAWALGRDISFELPKDLPAQGTNLPSSVPPIAASAHVASSTAVTVKGYHDGLQVSVVSHAAA
jgi:hypothetical protein